MRASRALKPVCKRVSVESQISMMARLFPQFEMKWMDGTLIWIGKIRPLLRSYKIAVIWNPSAAYAPDVIVLEPRLEPAPGCEMADLPHVYLNKENPHLSDLCLHYPPAKEWSPGMMIAKTIVMWAAQWLTYYELWRMDGIWRGGGIDHTPEVSNV